jgi:uncharacterized protein with PQ loop repeat
MSAVEIFGYCASAVIAFSLTRSSMIKLRWFNLLGASSFCLYGILINAYPVAILNGFIALTNVFFIYKILKHTQMEFSVIPMKTPSDYLDFFIDFHKRDIDSIFPNFFKDYKNKARRYFVLTKQTEVVGIVSGYVDENMLTVDFDFVIETYRDCKLGHFALGEGQEITNKFKFDKVWAKADTAIHEEYLQKIGFVKLDDTRWEYQTA